MQIYTFSVTSLFRFLKSIFLIISSIFILGCGGGGGDTTSSNPSTPATPVSNPYVVFPGNDATTAILDNRGDGFLVEVSTRNVIHHYTGFTLTGLTVDTSGVMSYYGTAFASVIIVKESSGGSFAYIACLGPAPNLGRVIIIVSSVTSYSWTCASNPNRTRLILGFEGMFQAEASFQREHLIRLAPAV